jgi:RNA polymerase sigma-32 factor
MNTGSANAVVVTLNPGPTQLVPCMAICIKKSANANTGSLYAECRFRRERHRSQQWLCASARRFACGGACSKTTIIDEEPKGKDHGGTELLRTGEYDDRPLRKRFSVLSEEEERELVSRWRTDPKAKDRLVLSHARLIQKIVRRHQRLGSLASNDEAYADVIAAGNGGFLRALERFDPDAGFRLVTFAWKWGEGEVLKLARENASIIKTPQRQKPKNDVSFSSAPYKGGFDNTGIQGAGVRSQKGDSRPRAY